MSKRIISPEEKEKAFIAQVKTLDPKGKYLVQMDSNWITVWTESMAKHPDMRILDIQNPKGIVSIPMAAGGPEMVSVILNDKEFLVEEGLCNVLKGMGETLNSLRNERDEMFGISNKYEALKERHSTDAEDLEKCLGVIGKLKADLGASEEVVDGLRREINKLENPPEPKKETSKSPTRPKK